MAQTEHNVAFDHPVLAAPLLAAIPTLWRSPDMPRSVVEGF